MITTKFKPQVSIHTVISFKIIIIQYKIKFNYCKYRLLLKQGTNAGIDPEMEIDVFLPTNIFVQNTLTDNGLNTGLDTC